MPEILGGFWGNIREELHPDSTSGDVADGDIEKYDWVLRVWRPHVPLYSCVASA